MKRIKMSRSAKSVDTLGPDRTKKTKKWIALDLTLKIKQLLLNQQKKTKNWRRLHLLCDWTLQQEPVLQTAGRAII